MLPRSIPIVAWCLMFPVVVEAAEIKALGGDYDEQVSSIEEDGGRLVVNTPQRAIPLDSVKTIRFQSASARPDLKDTKVLLGNGDGLRGSVEGGNRDSLGLRVQALGSLTVRLELVRAIIMSGASPERERDLQEKLGVAEEIDWVLLRNGGTVRGSIDQIDGTSVAIDTDTEGGSGMGMLRFEFSKVEMVSIAPLEKAKPPEDGGLRVSLGLLDGSRLRGRLERLSKNAFHLVHPLAPKGQQSLEIALARVVELSVLNGRFVYLSDLDPVQPVEQGFPPEFTYEVEVWGWKRDRNVTGGKLRLGGKQFEKGLGVHTYCKLTYDLGAGYKEFRSSIGLDDSTRYLGEPGFGAVVFTVLLDGKPAREFPSGVVQRKGQNPTEIQIDVKGKQTLTLIAGFDPTSLHVLGRANWADAHLIK